MQLTARILFSVSTCLIAACGSTAQNATPTRSLQAATMSADDAGASDLHTFGGTPASQKAAQRMVSRVVRNTSLALDSNVEFAGCLAHLTGTANASTDDSSSIENALSNLTATVDVNLVFLPGSCLGAKRSLSGFETIAAKFDTSGGTISAYQNLTTTFSDNSTMTVGGDDPNIPTYSLMTQPAATDGTLRVSVSVREHRRRVGADGSILFDIDFTSDPNAPLVIDNTYGSALSSPSLSARTIVSGTLHAMHRDTRVAVEHVFKNLARSAPSCSCPSSGTIVETETATDGTVVATRYTFSGCGKAEATVMSSTRPGTVTGQISAHKFEDCD